jgi:hypothetical protein
VILISAIAKVDGTVNAGGEAHTTGAADTASPISIRNTVIKYFFIKFNYRTRSALGKWLCL